MRALWAEPTRAFTTIYAKGYSLITSKGKLRQSVPRERVQQRNEMGAFVKQTPDNTLALTVSGKNKLVAEIL